MDPLLAYLKRPSSRRLAAVVEAHYRFVWTVALRLTASEDDAADVAQEVFLKLLLEPPSAGEVRSPRGFLAWSAVARASRLRRSDARRRRREERHQRQALAEHQEGGEDFEDLRDAVAELPEELRRAVELRYLAGLSTREAGEALGISDRAVRMRLERAVESLKCRLRPAFLGALVAGAAAGVDAAAAPPAALLGELLRIAASGAALAPPAAGGAGSASGAAASGAARIGGLLMSGKKALGLLACGAALVAGGLGVFHFGFRGGAAPERRQVAAAKGDAGRSAPAAAIAVRAGGGRVSGPPAEARVLDAPAAGGRAVLRGRVVDAAGAPVARAAVQAFASAAWNDLVVAAARRLRSEPDESKHLDLVMAALGSLTATAPLQSTDAEGRFAFEGIAAGPYRLAASHPEHPTDAGTVADAGADASTAVEIRLPPGQRIAGSVVDAAGHPVAGAEVEARLSPLARLRGRDRLSWLLERGDGAFLEACSRAARSAADGSFSTQALAPGAYDVAAVKDGYLEGALWELPSGSEGVVLRLDAGAAVSGRVVDDAGAAVPGARVRIEPARSAEVHRFFHRSPSIDGEDETRAEATDAEGRFAMQGLSDGPHRLTIESGGQIRRAGELALQLGPNDLGELRLDPLSALAGKVLDAASGAPIAGARVWVPLAERRARSANSLNWAAPRALVEAQSGADGGFAVEAPAGASLELRAEHPEHVAARLDGVALSARPIVFRLRRGLTLRGSVVSEAGGEAVEGARIKLYLAEGREVRSGAGGAFAIGGIDPALSHHGQIHLSAEHEDYDFLSKSVNVQSLDESFLLKLVLTRSRRVAGRVFGAGGAAVAGARVALQAEGLPPGTRLEDVASEPWTITGTGGEFAIKEPPALRSMIGTPKLFLLATDSAHAPARAGPLELPPVGEPWPELELILGEGARLEGRAVDLEGRPIAGARVDWRRWSAERAAADAVFGDNADEGSALSDSGGNFVLERLEPGQLEIEVSAVGFASRRFERFELPEDGARLDAVLDAGASIEGRVVDGAGSPLPDVEVAAFPARFAEPLAGERHSEFARRMRWRDAVGVRRARSGADGRFRLDRLAAEPILAAARLEGYEAAVSAAALPEGQRLDDLVLMRFSAVLGAVADAASGAPIADFEVDLIDVAERERIRRAERSSLAFSSAIGSQGALVFSDPLGRFLYDGLRPGRYELRVQARGFEPLVRDLDLEPGEEREVAVALERAAEVSGRVIDAATGGPVRWAEIHISGDLEKLNSSSFSSTLSDEDGRFRIAGLAPGDYAASAGHPFFRFDDKEWPRFKVPGDGGDLEIRMRPAGRIEGVLRGMRSGSRGGVKTHYSFSLVKPGEAAPRWQPSRSVDPDGGFKIDSVLPGRYELVLKVQDFREGRTIHIGPTGGVGALDPAGEERRIPLGEVEVAAGETIELDLEAPEGK
jgi:RNA polymerase sigma-70 factor (ECF subfamily)